MRIRIVFAAAVFEGCVIGFLCLNYIPMLFLNCVLLLSLKTAQQRSQIHPFAFLGIAKQRICHKISCKYNRNH